MAEDVFYVYTGDELTQASLAIEYAKRQLDLFNELTKLTREFNRHDMQLRCLGNELKVARPPALKAVGHAMALPECVMQCLYAVELSLASSTELEECIERLVMAIKASNDRLRETKSPEQTDEPE